MASAIEIFRRLIDDPDYQAKNGKTREEVVWEEAKQRERQHRNNNAALSLAWTDTPTLKSFIEYLYKADEEEEAGAETVIPEKSFFGPLEAIQQALEVHHENDKALPWSGPDRIGTLASLITPHIAALKTVLDGHVDSKINMEDSPNFAVRKELNRQINGTSPEETSGEYHSNVLSNLVNMYSQVEQDLRAVNNEYLDGRRLLQLGHSELTQDETPLEWEEEGEEVSTPAQRRDRMLEMWHHMLNYGEHIRTSDVIDGREQILRNIAQYLPSFDELPPPEQQLDLIRGSSKDQMVQGMYGNRAIGADMDDSEKSLNQAAVRQFLAQTDYKLPINSAFDHTRGELDQFSSETEASLKTDFNNFMRLTFWNPDKATGTANLWQILQGVVKTADSDPTIDGYYKLPPEMAAHLSEMSNDSRNAFLDDVINDIDPIRLLNPDEKGNSGINTVIENYSTLDSRIRNSSIRGRHFSKGFDIVQDPELASNQRPVHDLLRPSRPNSPLKTLMSDLGVLIDTEDWDLEEFNRLIDNVVSAEDPRELYTNHFPFGTVEPFMSLDDIKTQGPNVDKKVRAGSPLPDAKGEMRDFINYPYKNEDETDNTDLIDIRKRLNRQFINTTNTLQKVLEGDDHDYLSEVVPGYRDIWDNPAAAANNEMTRKEELEGIWNTLKPLLELEHAAYVQQQEEIRNEIERLEKIPTEKTKIPNPNLEQEQADYIDDFRDSAINFLEDRRLDVTEETIDELLNSENFKQEYEPLKPRKEIFQDPRPLDEEEEAALSGYKNELGRPMEFSQEVKDAQTHAKSRVDALSISTKPLIEQFANDTLQEYENMRDEGIQAMREIAIPEFEKVRRNDLKEIAAYMKENGVTSSEASRLLDIPLNPQEQQLFNDPELTPQPLITKGMISGDIASEMKGRTLPQNADFPTLHIAFEGGADAEQIKAIVNNHPTFQELQGLLENLDVDFKLLDSPTDRNHYGEEFDLYNPERTRRTLAPFMLSDEEPTVHPLDGVLQQDAEGRWAYTGALFDQDIDQLLSFMNEADLTRYLDHMSNLSFDSVAGETEDHVLVDKFVPRGGLDKWFYTRVPKQTPVLQDRLDDDGNPVLYPTLKDVPWHVAQEQVKEKDPVTGKKVRIPRTGYKERALATEEEKRREGKPIQDFVYDEEGKQVFEDVLDAEGNPVMERGGRIFENLDVPTGGEVMPHYEMPDGTLIPQGLPRQISPAWKADNRRKIDTRYTFLGNIHGTSKTSEFGVGRELASLLEAGSEFRYLQNIFNVIAEREANPEVFATRVRQQAQQLQEGRAERQRRTGEKISSLSRLPTEILEKMQNLMELYHEEALRENNESHYDFKVPENLKAHIEENLPIFSQKYSDHRQEHLDTFLTNFYRNWKREWTAEYDRMFNSIKDDAAFGPDLAEQVAKIIANARRKNRELPEDDPNKKSDSRDAVWVQNLRKQTERNLVEQADPEQFKRLRENMGPIIVDKLLSENNAKATEISLAQKVGDRIHHLPPEPRGATHIPVSVGGQWKEGLIPDIPSLAQFPLERFRTGDRIAVVTDENYTDDEGKPIPLPTAWFWLRKQAPYFEAMAHELGESVEYILKEGGMLTDNHRITTATIENWLTKYEFIGNKNTHKQFYADKVIEDFRGSVLPDTLIPKPNTFPLKGSFADKFREAIKTYNTSREEQQVQRQRETGIIDFLQVPESGDEYLKNVSQVPEMMDLIKAIYGSPEDLGQATQFIGPEQDEATGQPALRGRKEELLLMNLFNIKDVSESETEADKKPPPFTLDRSEGTDVNGDPFWYWDLSKKVDIYTEDDNGRWVIDEEKGGQSALQGLYDRLLRFTSGFTRRTWTPNIDDLGIERMAEGQSKQFIKTDGYGNRIVFEMPDPDTADPERAAQARARYNPVTDSWEKPQFNPNWQDDANTFTLLDNIFLLVKSLEDIHSAASITLPEIVTRNPLRVIIDEGSLPRTLENLIANPIDDEDDPTIEIGYLKEYFPENYFDDMNYTNEYESLKGPNSAKDVAIQLSGLRKFLTKVQRPKSDLSGNLREETTKEKEDRQNLLNILDSYISELEQISQEFNIPDIDLVSQFVISPTVKDLAEDVGIMVDGEFDLWDDMGNVNDMARTLLWKPMMARRAIPGEENQLALTAAMINNAANLNLNEGGDISISQNVKDVLYTLYAYGQKLGEMGKPNPFRDILKEDTITYDEDTETPLQGDIDALAVRNLFGNHIKGSRTGLDQLLMGRPRSDSSHMAQGHENRSPGIISWIHDHWNSHFDYEELGSAKPSNYTQSQERIAWGRGVSIRDYIKNLTSKDPVKIERQDVEPSDEDLKNIQQESAAEDAAEVAQFTTNYNNYLEEIKEGGHRNEDGSVNLDYLDSIIKDRDGNNFILVKQDLDAFKEALDTVTENDEVAINMIQPYIHKKHESTGADPWEPKMRSTELNIPNVPQNPEPPVNPLDNEVFGTSGTSPETGTQLGFDLDNNEENN